VPEVRVIRARHYSPNRIDSPKEKRHGGCYDCVWMVGKLYLTGLRKVCPSLDQNPRYAAYIRDFVKETRSPRDSLRYGGAKI